MTSNRAQIGKGDGFHIDFVFLKTQAFLFLIKKDCIRHLRKDVSIISSSVFHKKKCVSFKKEKKTVSLSVCG